ncbi:cation-transporting P-type ATPase [Verrucomicrobiaceae bacterium 5K15]|uniref:Cation-transporting P-type ATPase n=1 Tax=Oceaniferula flava TaxID=2800421 RepID=A0AAE2SBE7_9BACT|nr:cation-transporting P-type ATPase [Oceaniferula flavus]MBK1855106.1 cation-transporting P-type ATPase [Oceaniferula flavus]MBM1136412.1 cation-transporting P-type ATPase [Oceaniferula flavus]
MDSNWHHQSEKEVLEKLNTSADGLSHDEAEARLREHGPNRLPAAPKHSPLVRFFLHFHNILIYVLLGAAIITAALGHSIDTLVILAVVIANATIGFIQEGKAEKAMDAIHRMLALHASVIRNGLRRSVDGESLVVGDIVLLEAGDKVPADLRLLDARRLQVQESILTGESLAVEKSTHRVPEDAALGDRHCMAFSGTLVTSGTGKGVVVATAGETEIGQISGMLSEVETLTTPLVRQMSLFAKWLTVLILLLGGVLLAYGYFIAHFDFAELFMSVVGLSVAAIPEGLPAVLTITLAVGVQAMAKRNAIVRRLPAIETIGSVSVICTDKTGTLTRNEMMVASVVTSQHLFTIEGNGYEPHGRIKLDGETVTADEHEILRELGRSAALCNDASLQENENGWTIEGDPMEGALLALSAKTTADSSSWTRSDIIPFDAKHRFMATLDQHDNDALISVKGAPERILAMCQYQRSERDQVSPLDGPYWLEKAEEIAALGQRVLAIAVKPVPTELTELVFSDVGNGLVLLGLVGLMDPPREQSAAAVAECHSAGIAVKMITGDHRGTAAAIGKQIGLKNPDHVLTGADLEAMDDAELARAVIDTNIFARTSPEHKLRLVMALQSHDLTVAMTGDGVNDAPALKRADAGIAMGVSGSEAAKEAAELILADDNFSSITAAVREGRTVYDNIKKVISWTLPTNAGEAMTIVAALLLGMSLPITAVQILWANLITGVTLGIALAFEPTEVGTMHRKPRCRNEPLLDGALAWHIVLVAGLFLAGVFGMYTYAIDRGYSLELARTIALNTLVVMEIFHLFFIRNIYGTSLTWQLVRGTKMVWATVIVITVAQFVITYLPPLQSVFGTAAVPFVDGLIIVGVGIVLLLIVETEKQIRLRLQKLRQPA